MTGTLVTGDTFSGALSRAAGENVGLYAIGQGTLALSTSYTLTYVGADFTISAKPITATANAKMKSYGDADAALTYARCGVSSPVISATVLPRLDHSAAPHLGHPRDTH